MEPSAAGGEGPAQSTSIPRPRIGIVWRGDPAPAAILSERLEPVARALAEQGADVSPIPWSEAAADEAFALLCACDGALVWVDPLSQGQDRSVLDAALRRASEAGVWVSAHPDVILKMGVKEVLARTRTLGWGCDTHAYGAADQFRRAFPARLAADGVRVLKQNRGNGNQGVWKVQLRRPGGPVGPEAVVDVLEARCDVTEPGVRLGDFMRRCEAYFAGDGRLIDQAFQPRVGEGLIRCYVSRDDVIGFAEQFPRSRALGDPAAPTFGMESAKTMHRADAPAFQVLHRLMETDWIPGLQRLLRIPTSELPALWDADFLRGPKDAAGQDGYVLCEINVSCVTPFPPAAPAAVAAAAVAGMIERRRRRMDGN